MQADFCTMEVPFMNGSQQDSSSSFTPLAGWSNVSSPAHEEFCRMFADIASFKSICWNDCAFFLQIKWSHWFRTWVVKSKWTWLLLSPCRHRDLSSRLSWRESSFLSAMSQNQLSQTTDSFSQDVFNQLFDMLDQWVNSSRQHWSVTSKNKLWRLKNVSFLLQICHSFSPANWAELHRQSNRWVCRKHHSDQYGLHNHAWARWDVYCKYVCYSRKKCFYWFFTTTGKQVIQINYILAHDYITPLSAT